MMTTSLRLRLVLAILPVGRAAGAGICPSEAVTMARRTRNPNRDVMRGALVSGRIESPAKVLICLSHL